MKRIITCIVIITFLLSILSSCSILRKDMKKYQKDFYDVFDTYTTFTAYTNSEEEFLSISKAVHQEMLRLHKLFDIYNNYDGVSNLKTVNDHAGIAPVKVDGDIIKLLEYAKRAYEDTSGAVNIALGPVLQIWHKYRNEAIENPSKAEVPSIEELKEAFKFTAFKDIVINKENSTVFLPTKEMSIDVGAIAKGYAAQSAINLGKREGLTSGLLNAGGNVCAVGEPQNGTKYWSIGVQSPNKAKDGSQEILDIIYTTDCAVVSSGDYQRFYQVGEKTYHHIISPKTLFPTEGVHAVTIIHPDSTVAEILSTAAFILPYEQGKKLVEDLGGEGVWVMDKGTYYTDGYKKISKNNGAVNKKQ